MIILTRKNEREHRPCVFTFDFSRKQLGLVRGWAWGLEMQ